MPVACIALPSRPGVPASPREVVGDDRIASAMAVTPSSPIWLSDKSIICRFGCSGAAEADTLAIVREGGGGEDSGDSERDQIYHPRLHLKKENIATSNILMRVHCFVLDMALPRCWAPL